MARPNPPKQRPKTASERPSPDPAAAVVATLCQQGRSPSEIAGILGIEVRSVYRRKARARKQGMVVTEIPGAAAAAVASTAYPCDHCDDAFPSDAARQRHAENAHGATPRDAATGRLKPKDTGARLLAHGGKGVLPEDLKQGGYILGVYASGPDLPDGFVKLESRDSVSTEHLREPGERDTPVGEWKEGLGFKMGEAIHDLGAHDALDFYSPQEHAERISERARRRGATRAIVTYEDGSEVEYAL